MSGREDVSWKRKLLSLIATTLLVMGSLLVGITFQVPEASAGNVDHDIGNLDVRMLSDFGRIYIPIIWGGYQTTVDQGSGLGFIGLVVDQDNYDHTDPMDIADSFLTAPYSTADDFTVTTGIDFVIENSTTQKSFAAYQNTEATTGDPNDILINQTAWTVLNKDWAILQWSVLNLKAVPVTNFCLALELSLSQEGAGGGVGGDSGDDVDGYDAINDTYWAQDNGVGAGTCIGFGSAIATDPITHYYSEDYHPATYNDYRVYWEDDTWLYNRIHAASAAAGLTPGNRTSTVGWNGVTLGVGEARTFTMVIAVNNTFDDMNTAIKDAQYYYNNVATGFLLTEIKDSGSGSAQIEVYNFGREPTDPSAVLSLSANSGPLTTGSWVPNPVPTYGYSVFTANEVVDSEGDTITLSEGGSPIASVSFGQEGIAPDPLDAGSVARRWDSTTASYSDDWLGSTSSGPTWGTQNDVPSVKSVPQVVINEVIFNPGIPELAFVELMFLGGGSVDLLGYRIVCDTEYTIPISVLLGPQNPHYTIIQSNDTNLFSQMDSSGDNIYLYDNNGQLLDMFGWSSPHLQGMSARRIPDGDGTYQGYNDVTSAAAGWVFNLPLETYITELSDSASAVSQIEVYNPRYQLIDFSLDFSFTSLSQGALTGTWSTPQASSNGYAVFDVSTPSGLHPEGDTVFFYQNGVLIEEISYGLFGLVPDPLADESVQRYWDGVGYTDIWGRNWTTGPNLGAQNNIPAANFSSWILLNEVLFFPSIVDNYFVEVYNRMDSPVDISGYKIVGDTEFIVPDGTILNTKQHFFYLLYAMDPNFFVPNMDSGGDNVYLYDAAGSLLDMVGWSSQHTIDFTICRVPDGNGTSDGYDNVSSVAARWRFGQAPSISIIQIGPDTQQYSGKGENVKYYLDIYNMDKNRDHVMDISNVTGPWGWEVITQNESGDPLIDSNSNGIPDIFVPAGGRVFIIVVVKVPTSASPGDNETTIITAKSAFNPFFIDNAILVTRVKTIQTVTFPGSSFVIPMDDKQNDVLKAFGFVHALLRNGSLIYRIIEPPDIVISTILYPLKEIFAGGPILVMPSDATIVNAVHSKFPSVTLDTTISTFISDKVDIIYKPTNILVIYGIYGHTQDVLNDMEIPFTMVYTSDVENDPNMLFKYDLIVDDCPGWGGSVPSTVSNNMQIIAEQGGEVIFTDIALRDLDAVFPGHIPVTPNVDGTWPCSVYRIPEFPGQYYGPSTLDIYTMTSGQIMMAPTDPNVRIMVDSYDYNGEYRVLAAYFYYGSGIYSGGVVEGFGYHPGDQPPDARVLASVFFGNKFVHLPPAPVIPDIIPPTLYIKTVGDNIILNWTQPTTEGLSHYLIYRSTSQTGFDFSNVWVNTSLHNDNGIIPLRTTWNDTGVGSGNAPQEYYYIIRTVFKSGEISYTSRTVGKWTKTFSQGTSTFSLPLEPIDFLDTDNLTSDMNADYIQYMDPIDRNWLRHNIGDGPINNPQMKLGEGYEVSFSSQKNYTFTGLPGSMIVHIENPLLGFDPQTEARNLSLAVEPNGDVTLNWKEPVNMDTGDWYEIYYSNTRNGFFGTLNVNYFAACPSVNYGMSTATHLNAQANSPGARLYYMVVPYNSSGIRGSSTYSLGIWTETLNSEYDSFGIPLKPSLLQTADWFCDNIPDTLGINYYNTGEQRWYWHSIRMGPGAFDPQLLMSEGYQISTTNATKYTFIGV